MSLALIPGLGRQESLLVFSLLILWVVPIWLSIRIYRENQAHWRLFSVLATVCFSWIGFIVVRSIRAGASGYVDGRTKPS